MRLSPQWSCEGGTMRPIHAVTLNHQGQISYTDGGFHGSFTARGQQSRVHACRGISEAAPQTYARIFSFTDGNQEVTNVSSPSTVSGGSRGRVRLQCERHQCDRSGSFRRVAAWQTSGRSSGFPEPEPSRVHEPIGTLSHKRAPDLGAGPDRRTLRHLLVVVHFQPWDVGAGGASGPWDQDGQRQRLSDIPFTTEFEFGAGLSPSDGTGDDYPGGFRVSPAARRSRKSSCRRETSHDDFGSATTSLVTRRPCAVASWLP